MTLNTISVHNFKFPLSVYISADTDCFWQRPRGDKVQSSFVNVDVWHHHRELVSLCTDRTEAVIRNDWQGAFHLWWEKIFVSKYLSAGTIFLQAFLVLHIFCIIMKRGAERENYCIVLLLSDKITDVLHLQITNVWKLSYCDIDRYHSLGGNIFNTWKKNNKGIKVFKALFIEHFKTYLTKLKHQAQKCVLRI